MSCLLRADVTSAGAAAPPTVAGSTTTHGRLQRAHVREVARRIDAVVPVRRARRVRRHCGPLAEVWHRVECHAARAPPRTRRPTPGSSCCPSAHDGPHQVLPQPGAHALPQPQPGAHALPSQRSPANPNQATHAPTPTRTGRPTLHPNPSRVPSDAPRQPGWPHPARDSSRGWPHAHRADASPSDRRRSSRVPAADGRHCPAAAAVPLPPPPDGRPAASRHGLRRRRPRDALRRRRRPPPPPPPPPRCASTVALATASASAATVNTANSPHRALLVSRDGIDRSRPDSL